MINELTKKTIEDTDKNLNIIECETAEEMFKKLGIGTKRREHTDFLLLAGEGPRMR